MPASVALPPPSRAPPVVEGMAIVAADGAKTVLRNLKPEEVFSASASVISWLADEDRGKFAKLPSEVYTGVLLQRERGRPNAFIANASFFEFMQFAMASIGPDLSCLLFGAREAQRTGGLNLSIYDARIDPWLVDHPSEMPADEEAMGCFQVREGKITTDSNLGNTKYNRWSSDGPTRIPVHFYDALLQRLLVATGRNRDITFEAGTSAFGHSPPVGLWIRVTAMGRIQL